MDEIILEKIWEDETFYEIRIKIITDKISIVHQMYMNNGELSSLSKKINKFIESKDEIMWSDTENIESSSLIFNFINIDALGNIKVVIDVLNEDYKCRFYFNTYLGNLICFSNKLIKFDEYSIGMELHLSNQ